VQQPGLAETSQGKVAWKGDALSKILGEEKPGHVHGLGLVPNPNQVFNASTSKRLKNVNLTSLDETSSEDVVSLRLELEKLGQHVRNQDATILQLQHKGCLDDPVYAPNDGCCADVPNTKRKRVYSDPQSQDFSMDGQLNDTMNEHGDNVEDDDLQPHYKFLSPTKMRQNVVKQRKIDVASSKKQVAEHSYEARNLDSSTPATINISSQMEQDDYVGHEDLATHYKYNYTKYKEKHIHNDVMLDKSKCTNKIKVVAKETSAIPSNFEASDYQKHHCGKTNWSTGNSMTIGTKVYLQSGKNQNKSVALGTILSCDPTQKLDGVQLGKEFWMVRVSFAIVDDEPLIRPYKGYKVIGDVEGGVIVAWPSTFIKKINI